MAKTESDLLPCPFCGSPADPEGWSSIDRKGPACTNGECDGAADSAEAWNRRAANSDGGVEPVSWQRRPKYLPNGANGLWEQCGSKEATDPFERSPVHEYRPLYAHPPAKALDGIAVSEGMLERMMDGIMGPGWRTFNPDSVTALRNLYSIAIEAALAVR